MYNYNVEFVLEQMVILTTVTTESGDLYDDDIIQIAVDNLKSYYKIDPTVLYPQDIVIHEA